jgi:hypothetical protein
LIKPNLVLPVAVRGGIPSLERAVGDHEVAAVSAWTDEPTDASWSNPQPGAVIRAMDRFHPVPRIDEHGTSTAGFSAASWAEWLYFNGHTADGSLRFYLTFLAGPPADNGRRAAIVRLQLDRSGRAENYSAAAEVDAAALLAGAPDLDIAGNRVRIEGATYHLTLSLAREHSGESRIPNPGLLEAQAAMTASKGKSRLEGEIVLDVPSGRSLPPVVIHGARGWLSGYVVPVLSGPLRGTLRIGNDTIALDTATGYHDHNWGFWEGVRWQWGQVASGDVSIVFGRVFPPSTVAAPERVPGFLGVLGPSGPLGFSTDVAITERDEEGAPRAVTVEARGSRLAVHLTMTVDESVATRMPLTRLPGSAAMSFLQLGGSFRVEGHAGDRALAFTARGSAETFRAISPASPTVLRLR